jgi:hypothetical protein
LKALTHPVTVAFGLANLYLVSMTEPLVASEHELVYHMTGSASVIFIPVLIYLIVLSGLLAVLLMLVERHGRLRGIVWSGAVFALPWILLRSCAGLMEDTVPTWISLLVGLASLLIFVVIAVRWRSIRPAFEEVQPVVATVLGVFALCGLVVFAHLIWFGWQARDLNPAPTLHHPQLIKGSPHQRIVWIVLDELSYQQVYERRFPGLQLPAFDQLAADSTVFTHVVPAGRFTRQVIPSLFTGIPSDEVDVSGAGLLVTIHDTASGRWDRFQQHKTVFQDAIDAGYTTGVAGWFNPYCRILPAVLDHCYWTFRKDNVAGGLSPNKSAAANLVLPFRMLWLDIGNFLRNGTLPPSEERIDIQMHTADYRELLAAGDSLLSDPSVGFVFLHMPVPHPYGFYDRKSEGFATHHTSYIDNLALADRYLAHVRQLLEQEHEWDSSAVVVMGDHSWRTSFVWKNSAGWTAEDEAASHGGQFDSRPAYIVKLPNQQTGERMDASFGAIRTRAMFDAMMQNRLRTPEALEQWARQ